MITRYFLSTNHQGQYQLLNQFQKEIQGHIRYKSKLQTAFTLHLQRLKLTYMMLIAIFRRCKSILFI